jgi:hypothetical protein
LHISFFRVNKNPSHSVFAYYCYCCCYCYCFLMEELFDTIYEIPHFVDDPRWDCRWFEEEASKRILDSIAKILLEKHRQSEVTSFFRREAMPEQEHPLVAICLMQTHSTSPRRRSRFLDRLRDVITHQRHKSVTEIQYYVVETPQLPSGKSRESICCNFFLFNKIGQSDRHELVDYQVVIRPTLCIHQEVRGIGGDFLFLVDYLPPSSGGYVEEVNIHSHFRALSEEEIIHNVVRPMKECLNTPIHLIQESRTQNFDKSGACEVFNWKSGAVRQIVQTLLDSSTSSTSSSSSFT